MQLEEKIFEVLNGKFPYIGTANCITICNIFFSFITENDKAKLMELFNLYNGDIIIESLQLNKQTIYTYEDFKTIPIDKIQSVCISIYGHILDTNDYAMLLNCQASKYPYAILEINKYSFNVMRIYAPTVDVLYNKFITEIDRI